MAVEVWVGKGLVGGSGNKVGRNEKETVVHVAKVESG